jgi:hypothetical protein
MSGDAAIEVAGDGSLGGGEPNGWGDAASGATRGDDELGGGDEDPGDMGDEGTAK